MKPALSLLLVLLCPLFCQSEDLLKQLEEVHRLVRATEYQKALTEANRIVERAKQAHNLEALAEAYFEISDAQYYLGNREQMKRFAEEALAVFRKLNDHVGIARCYYALSYYYERTEPEQMIHLLDLAKKYADQANAPSVQTVIENAYGMAFTNLSQFRLAAKHYEASARIAESENDEHRLAIALANVGTNYSSLGDYTKALEYFDRALLIARKTGDKRALTVVLGPRGQVYLALGNADEALSSFLQCLALHEESGYKKGQLRQLDNIADVYFLMGEREAYSSYRQKGLAISEEIGDDLVTTVGLIDLAESLILQDRYEEAESNLQRAEDFARRIKNASLLGRAKRMHSVLELRRNAFDAAQKDLDAALALYKSTDDWYALGFLWSAQGRLYELQDKIPQAIDAYLRAVSLHESTHTANDLPEWYRKIAQLNADIGNNLKAKEFFEKSLSHINRLDSILIMDRFRVNLFREVTNIYHGYALWLASQGFTQRAWEVIEQGRARTLRFRMTQALETTTLSDAERDSLGQLSKLQRTLREEELSRDESDVVLKKISLVESKYEQASYQAAKTRPVKIEKDQLQFPDPGILVVEYALYDDDLLIFSRDQGVTHYRTISPAEPLLLKAREFQQQASRYQAPKQSDALGRDLFKTLLEPELKNRKSGRIILIPDDVLWSLPFSALVNGDGEYLAERYAVSIVPSLETLTRLKERRYPDQKSLVAFANTSFPDTQKSPVPLPPLPGVAGEAGMLANSMKEAMVMMNQSESKVKQMDFSRFKVVHFATHTLVDETHNERSCIVVAADSQEDGYLQVREIYRMKIPAEMIVLSGCRSGAGATVAGEGLLGLSHSLFAAGGRTLVSTLWELSDEGTLQFMKAFYGALKHQTIAEALQTAQVKMMHSRKWNHPGYWAGFVVMGDADHKLDLPWATPQWIFWLAFAFALALIILITALLHQKRRRSETIFF